MSSSVPQGAGRPAFCRHELPPQNPPSNNEISLQRCMARKDEMFAPGRGGNRARRFLKADWANGPADDWGWGYVWGYRRAQYHFMKHLERAVFAGFMSLYDPQRQAQRQRRQSGGGGQGRPGGPRPVTPGPAGGAGRPGSQRPN